MDKIPLYMLVSNDRYELPLAVADTVYDLAEMIGVTGGSIAKGVRRWEAGGKSQYRRVWVYFTKREIDEYRGRTNVLRQRAMFRRFA